MQIIQSNINKYNKGLVKSPSRKLRFGAFQSILFFYRPIHSNFFTGYALGLILFLQSLQILVLFLELTFCFWKYLTCGIRIGEIKIAGFIHFRFFRFGLWRALLFGMGSGALFTVTNSNEAILKLNHLMGNESYSIRRKIWTH